MPLPLGAFLPLCPLKTVTGLRGDFNDRKNGSFFKVHFSVVTLSNFYYSTDSSSNWLEILSNRYKIRDLNNAFLLHMCRNTNHLWKLSSASCATHFEAPNVKFQSRTKIWIIQYIYIKYYFHIPIYKWRLLFILFHNHFTIVLIFSWD